MPKEFSQLHVMHRLTVNVDSTVYFNGGFTHSLFLIVFMTNFHAAVFSNGCEYMYCRRRRRIIYSTSRSGHMRRGRFANYNGRIKIEKCCPINSVTPALKLISHTSRFVRKPTRNKHCRCLQSAE